MLLLRESWHHLILGWRMYLCIDGQKMFPSIYPYRSFDITQIAAMTSAPAHKKKMVLVPGSF